MNPCNHIIGSLLVAWSVCLTSALAEPALIDFEFYEDFENGTISGWSSYPPFQDTAYDYSILAGYYRPPETLQGYIASGEFFYPVDLAPPGNPQTNKFYCLRAYRPNSVAGQRIGFTRRCSIITSEDSSFRCDLWAKHPAVMLIIQLACNDGRRYENVIGLVGIEAWNSFDIPLKHFTVDGENFRTGLEIQAVLIEVHYLRGDPAKLYHVAIDNIRLNGNRRAGFQLQSPVAQTFDHWPLAMAKTHFNTSDRLRIVAKPEVSITNATAWLETLEGAVIGVERELSFEDDAWIADDLHTFKEGDPTGPLNLILEGETEEGKSVRTESRLWYLPSPKGPGRPNLFFGEKTIEKLRARKDSGRGKEIWERLRGQAASARTKAVPDEGQVGEFPEDYLIQQLRPYFDAIRTTAHNAMLNAWVYAIEGDEEAGAYAKGSALKLTGWDTWTHPWFLTQGRKTYYPVGLTAMYLGIAYDLIHPLLSDEEAAKIREGVVKNGIENAYEEYFVDNRVPNHTSNWVSHCTAGPLVALCAFYPDVEGEEKAEIERLFSGLAEKFLAHCKATFTPDGAYGEGYGYQNFTLESASPFLAGLENLFGRNNLVNSLNIAQSYLFPLYITVDEGKALLDMGDSSDSTGVRTNWAWLAQRLDDPLLKDFYHSSSGSDWEDFLWMEEEPKTSGPESLPPSRYFPDKGNVIFRTGWGEDDMVLNYHAGPHFNHTHADQGHFRMWAYGEELVSEAGKAGYYTDPYYWSYFIQAGGHNTVLADGISESQEYGDFKNEVVAFDRRAKIEKVHLSRVFSVVSSELAAVYRGSHDGILESFNRTLCFIDPGYVVVRDRLKGDQSYQWQLFPPQAEGFSVEGPRGVYSGEKARLEFEILKPVDPEITILKRPIQMGEYAKYPSEPLRPRCVLQIDGGVVSEGLEFLVFLTPNPLTEDLDYQIEKTDRDGLNGILVRRSDQFDEILFDDDGNQVLFTRMTGDKRIVFDVIDLK